jgi:hypothetical protein
MVEEKAAALALLACLALVIRLVIEVIRTDRRG